jgi:hypothetical protein
MKQSHMLFCAALVIAGAALVAAGVSAGALIPAIACMAMMGGMVWAMGKRASR